MPLSGDGKPNARTAAPVATARRAISAPRASPPTIAIVSSRQCRIGAISVSVREPRDDFLADDLYRAHHLRVGEVARLQHEDKLIDAGHGPFLDLPADRVGVAADCHGVLDELVVAALGDLVGDLLAALLGRAEAVAVHLGIVVAVIPARGRTNEVAPPAVVFVEARDRIGADMLVGEFADVVRAVAASDRSAVGPRPRLGLGRRVAGAARNAPPPRDPQHTGLAKSAAPPP